MSTLSEHRWNKQVKHSSSGNGVLSTTLDTPAQQCRTAFPPSLNTCYPKGQGKLIFSESQVIWAQFMC